MEIILEMKYLFTQVTISTTMSYYIRFDFNIMSNPK